MESENSQQEEKDLIDEAVAWLQRVLPSTWKISRSTTTYLAADRAPRQPDAAIDIEGSGMRATLITEARESFAPRDVERMFSGPSIVRSLRAVSPNLPILVVARWLSRRTRELLEKEEVNYVDLTGNAYLRIDAPQVIYVRTDGAQRNSRPSPVGEVQLRGPRAGRVLRLLLDVRPPFGVREVAEMTGVAVSYVSRLLESLDRDALLNRGARGRVEDVDISRLLLRWSDSYDLFKSNTATNYVAPRGPGELLESLRGAMPRRTAITGSFAAVRYAAIAAPSLLVVHAEEPDTVVKEINLLRTVERPNVVLLRPYDPVVFERTERDDGLTYVAPSQATVDCLAGNGRMPAEGEALMSWLESNKSAWQVPSISEVRLIKR